MDQTLRKRSVMIAGHATSISLEPIFWEGARKIARQRGLRINQFIEIVDKKRTGNLSSALRITVLEAALNGEIKRETVSGSDGQ